MNPVDNADDNFQDFPFSMYSMHPSLDTTICVNKHEYVFLAKVIIWLSVATFMATKREDDD